MTAAVLVIGDEILSGRTKDKNIGYIAEYLGKLGVDLREARVVPDVEEEIVAALNALRGRYDYVITTGGIGPTHDDITADAVGARVRRARRRGPARDRHHARALRAPADLTPARRRMARMPEGSALVENPISRAPGFRIGNVFVLAGVPSVMQAMLDSAVREMRTGAVMQVESIEAGGVPEGRYGDALGAIAEANPAVSIGSYPVVQGRAVHEPDRGARQGRGGGPDGEGGGRGDARRDPGRRQAALRAAAPPSVPFSIVFRHFISLRHLSKDRRGRRLINNITNC